MPISSKLLSRAYTLFEAGDRESAARILESVLESDPANIEAWEFFLQICDCVEDLEWIADRVQQNDTLNETEKLDILDYYNYRVDRLAEGSPEQEVNSEAPIIVPWDLERSSEGPGSSRRRESFKIPLFSSRNVVPLTLALLIATYILDKTIPNNGLIGFFIVLSLSFLYIYWLTTVGVLNREGESSRSFAKDIEGLENRSAEESLIFHQNPEPEDKELPPF